MPSKLGAAGRKLWRAMTSEFEIAEGEVRVIALLEAAVRQADDVALLEEALARDGVTVVGSRGQARMNPVVAELRQSRLALARLLGELPVPEPEADDVPTTAASRRAQRAADIRWAKVAARKARRA
jgi:hypothetical protein